MKNKLIIGNKNFSSWSLRGWLMVRHVELDVEEILIKLRLPDSKKNILKHSPSGKVPTLHHNNLIIWDSLAIGEYLAELYPDKHLWPKNQKERAHARAIVAEMHAGFQALRNDYPMDISARITTVPMTEDLNKDIQRVLEIWSSCLKKSNGQFLFGDWSLADMFYAPVVSRFITYGVQVPENISLYMEIVMSHPHLLEWNT
jgi:glutathione S-transferase